MFKNHTYQHTIHFSVWFLTCKHNRFRSKVAEAIFNTEIKKLISAPKTPIKNKEGVLDELNKNKKIIAESAGIIGSENSTPDSVINILKEKGYEVKRKAAKRVDSIKINDYDILIITADNVDPLFFKDSFKGKIIWWKISDCMDTDIKGIKKRVNEIEENVKELVKDLKESS